jgi:hypothetical protein
LIAEGSAEDVYGHIVDGDRVRGQRVVLDDPQP